MLDRRPPRDPHDPRAATALERGVRRRSVLQNVLLTGGPAPTAPPVLRLRAAETADSEILRDLAARDGGRVPGAPRVIAEHEGAAVAVIGVLDRRVLVDPVRPEAVRLEAIDALQAVAAERRGPLRRRRWAAALRRTPAADMAR